MITVMMFTVLVNGLPLVHIELKRRRSNSIGVQSVVRYQRESFRLAADCLSMCRFCYL